MMKLLYICEDYVPPVTNGSGLVYLACLEALAQEYDVYSIMFADDLGRVGRETSDKLESLCKAHLVLPGVNRNPPVQLARTLSRAVTGQLIAPTMLEEMGRSGIQDKVARFIRNNAPAAMYVHKYNCVPRLGRDIVASFSGVRILDLHDDFVAKEGLERSALQRLLREYPELRKYAPYARIDLKNRLSRFSAIASRRQELEILSMFDWVVAASDNEARAYSTYLPGRVVYCPWPVSSSAGLAPSRESKYAAGFIGSDMIFNLEGLMAFVTKELPHIRQRDPRFTFVVAGGISEPFRLACPLHDTLGVTVLGRLRDIAEFYSSVSVVVVPLLHGTGISLKTLEAASYGIPVVSTPVGVRGIPSSRLPSNLVVVDLNGFSQMMTATAARWHRTQSGTTQAEETAAYLGKIAGIVTSYGVQNGSPYSAPAPLRSVGSFRRHSS